MPAPYRGDEIAAAVIAAAGREGVSIGRVTVVADEIANRWLIRIDLMGEERAFTFPFASARGIFTPADIALRVIRHDWPFG